MEKTKRAPRVSAPGSEWMYPEETARAIGVHAGELPSLPIERIDNRKPGARKPVYRYRRTSVQAYLASRTEPAVQAAAGQGRVAVDVPARLRGGA
jgi:histone H3/H4